MTLIFFFQGFEGQRQLQFVVAIEFNVTRALWQSQPSPEVVADLPFQSLNSCKLSCVDKEKLLNPRRNAMLNFQDRPWNSVQVNWIDVLSVLVL